MSGAPTTPTLTPVRPPSYSGPYATSNTQTEDAINSAALTAFWAEYPDFPNPPAPPATS